MKSAESRRSISQYSRRASAISQQPAHNFGWRQHLLTISGLAQNDAYLAEKAKDQYESESEPEEQIPTASWFQLLRFAKFKDVCLMLLGTVMACINGMFMPLNCVIYGEFTALLIDRTVMSTTSSKTLTLSLFGGGRILSNANAAENKKALIEDSIAFGIGCTVFSVLQFIVAAISVDLYNWAALRQFMLWSFAYLLELWSSAFLAIENCTPIYHEINRLKENFLRAILHQDSIWFDLNTTLNFATKVSDDVEKYREGIAEKVPILIYLVTSFFYAVTMSLFYGWKLTLIILAAAPVIIATAGIVAKVQSSITSKELKAYNVAGIIAEEVLSSIRTVVAFGGEEKEVQRYKAHLEPAKKMGALKGAYSGLGSGITWLTVYATYALSFWYGVELILECRHDKEPVYTPAVLMIVFFSVLQGAQNIGLTAPFMESVNSARASGAAIFSVIDRKPAIDSLSNEGETPAIDGDLELENVFFSYPARPGVPILRGINLKISKNETVALVGSTGCGKSTVLQLLQRMYDPESGMITVSGHDLRSINVMHLRNHIAVVGQEPVLFAGSIWFNIRISNPTCTNEEIMLAAKQANCHDFIKMLPNGYDTIIGERGAQLSGGQKQRIAIARALLRKPKILLLDEATSALDSHSEALVQKALDAAAEGRTTVMVSHRLVTTVNATRIVMIEGGIVMEQGTHDELMALKGRYYSLVLEHEPQLARLTTSSKSALKKTKLRVRTVLPHEEKLGFHESTFLFEHSQEGSVTEPERQIKPTNWQILNLCKPEKNLMLVGVCAATVVGSACPTFAVLMGETYGLFQSSDENWVRSGAHIIELTFLIAGFIIGTGIFFQIFVFNLTGVRLTARLRVAAFKHMLAQEIAWFDHPLNGVGALCTRLASDAAAVQGATGTRMGALVQAAATILIGLALSMYLSWRMTLISLVSMPMVMGSVILDSRVMSAGLAVVREASSRATSIATEAITNIRTVAAFCGENDILRRYQDAEQCAYLAARRSVRWRGCVFAFGLTAPVAGYALALWYGGVLVANQEILYKNVIKVSEALIFGAWMMGQALAFAPNFSAAVSAAGRVLTLLYREPKVCDTTAPAVTERYIATGKIEYDKIRFRYPTRREVEVLRGFSLIIPSGKRVALVGPSGCGKSTLVQLLQRLYDPDNGAVLLDDYNIASDIRISTLRSNLGIVSQEPVLFDRTIAENIAYGDNTREVATEEIIFAAKKANVHSFIVALPNGYDTRIGARASQLSGGQKQRIAIARALVRNPRILLLDEATSALDKHSEKIVQSALDRASEGRTCLIVAHRLSTIETADIICVIDCGVIAEKGTHEELLQLKGIYAKLYELQCGLSEDDGATVSTQTGT